VCVCVCVVGTVAMSGDVNYLEVAGSMSNLTKSGPVRRVGETQVCQAFPVVSICIYAHSSRENTKVV
jgi:hypothetical protein